MNPTSIHPEIEKLITLFQNTTPENLYSSDVSKIHVSHIMSHVSSFYENIRNAIDYNEEHLVRKNAIQRILKRRIRVSLSNKNIGKSLIYELIRAKYLENNFVPETKIDDVEKIVQKYLLWLDLISKLHGLSAKMKHFDWVIGIASCEIEEALSLIARNDAMVNAMYAVMSTKIVFPENFLDDSERNLQVYIAIHRALIKSDQSILAYHLLNLHYRQFRHADESLLYELAQKIQELRDTFSTQLSHPISQKLARLLQRSTMYFTIIRDVIEQKESTAYSRVVENSLLESSVKGAATKRYQMAARKLTRSIVNSVIYIFVTKIILAFVLELPYEVFVLNEFNPLPLSINVLFPPLLMFIIARSAHLPSSQNTNAILAGVKNIVYEEDIAIDEYKVSLDTKRTVWKTAIFSLIYFGIYFLTFGVVVYFLQLLRFNVVSIGLFLLFLCVVSFFGIKIRQSVKSLNVLKTKEGFFSSLVDFFFLPILNVGRWISTKFSKINVLAFALDFIIEAPLKTVIEVVEDWFTYMKEKKEEIY